MMWYDGSGDHMGGWAYAVMGLGSLLLWTFLVLGVVALLRHLGRSTGPSAAALPADAEHVLAGRFARGEIDEDEYHHRVDVLRGKARQATAS